MEGPIPKFRFSNEEESCEEAVGEFVRVLRKKTSWSQGAVAQRLRQGLNRTTIGRYEKGQLPVPLGYMAWLARELLAYLEQEERSGDGEQAVLLQEINHAIETCYIHDRKFARWEDVVEEARRYFESVGERLKAVRADSEEPAARTQRRGMPKGRHLPQQRYIVLHGRDREIHEIETLIRDPGEPRLIWISGFAGNGKTALAREVAERCLSHADIADVLWVTAQRKELEGTRIRLVNRKPLDVAGMISELIKQSDRTVTRKTVDTQRQVLADLFKAKKYLVVLDNLDESLDELELARASLEIIGKSKLLVSSRNQRIDELDHVRAVHLQGLEKADTVRFLREEASRRGLMELAEAKTSQLEEVYQLTQGAPLAVKLIVGQCGIWPLERVLEHLRGAPELREGYYQEFYLYLFERAWATLVSSTAAKKLLMYIATMIPASITYAQLRHMRVLEQGFDAALELLIRLCLIDNTHNITKNQQRLTLHPLLRQFVNDILPQISDAEEATRLEPAELAAKTAQGWFKLCDQNPRILLRSDERHNVLYCMDQCLAYRQFDWIAKFWDSLTRRLYRFGYWDDYEKFEHHCLEAARDLHDRWMEAWVLSELGWLAMERGEIDRAEPLIRASLDLFTQRSDLRGIFITTRYLANVAIWRHQYELARGQLQELLKDIDSTIPTADADLQVQLKKQAMMVHGLIGLILMELNDYEGAERELWASIKYAELVTPFSRAIAFLNLGELRLKQRRLVDTRVQLNEALDICRREQMPHPTARVLYHLAMVAKEDGNLKEAKALAQKAARILRMIGDPITEKKVRDFLESLSRSNHDLKG